MRETLPGPLTPMSLKSKITEDIESRDEGERSAAPFPRFACCSPRSKQREVDERKDLSDGEITAVIEKMIKQRRDSISQFQAANRQDLVDVETFELNLLAGYLPSN